MRRWPAQSKAEILHEIRESAFKDVVPQMNREERRTAKGKMLVAKGEAAALKAENEYLRAELKRLGYEE